MRRNRLFILNDTEMKKILFILLGTVAIVSCSLFDDEWYGSYNYGENAGREYVFCVANDLIVDNLKQIETAVYIDGLGTSSASTRFEHTASLWDAGSVWTVTKKGGNLAGLHITRAAADSTWILTRKGKYAFGSAGYSYYSDDEDEYSFDTDYEMEVHMLPDTTATPSANHYWWEVNLKKCERVGEMGYKALFNTPAGTPLVYTYGSFGGGWAYCRGVLNMQVYKNGELVDVARLELDGTRNSANYLRNL